VTLPPSLAVGHVYGRSPEDEEDVLYRWEATSVPVTTAFLASPSFAAARL
jgi:hypothetical protein